ncbi:MAG: hypothetical protein LBR30_05325 [Clostridioides sp.]|jgi:hypothetical protein|nr:hypothetical protein [Clostridioides sp.]
MGIRDKFAESFARSKTMSGPEKKANEIIGKLILQKALIPFALMLIVSIAGPLLKINGWITVAVILIIAVAAFFYVKNTSKKFQVFKPYAGNLISLEKVKKGQYIAIIKQGKLPVKLHISYGGEDLEHIKKNQLVQVNYNPEAKIAIVVKYH